MWTIFFFLSLTAVNKLLKLPMLWFVLVRLTLHRYRLCSSVLNKKSEIEGEMGEALPGLQARFDESSP